MNAPWNSEIFRRAAQRAAQRPFFLAHDLLLYRSLYQMGQQELAEFLECPEEALTRLALCRRPDSSSPAFRPEVEQVAAYSEANPFRLARLFRETDTVRSLRQAGEQAEGSQVRGMLLAARDRLPAEGVSEVEPPETHEDEGTPERGGPEGNSEG